MFKILLRVCEFAPGAALSTRQALLRRRKVFQPTTKVRKGHEFDSANLLAFLRKELCNQTLPDEDDAINIGQFSWGQSNPSFPILWGKEGKGLVVRKQPPGKLLKGAHDVGREYKAMSALANTSVPVPRTRLFCEDTSILGTNFFVYEYVPGRFFHDQYLSNVKDVHERLAIYKAFAETVATLHAVQPTSTVGLEALGKCSGGYLSRQVSTWSKQYRKSLEAAPDLLNPSMDILVEVLPALAAMPEVDEGSAGSRLTHGDLRLDNMIFDAKVGFYIIYLSFFSM